jgi:hypothetical protein
MSQVLHYLMDLETQVGHWKQKLVSSLEVEERGGQVVKWHHVHHPP